MLPECLQLPGQAGTFAHILKEALAAGLLSILRMGVTYFGRRTDCSLPESCPSQVDTKQVTKLPQLCGKAASCSWAGECTEGSPGLVASLQYPEAGVLVK